MIHLRSLSYRAPADANRFPFNVPAVRSLDEISFTHPVTFLVGENGSGKSTLLEGIAAAVQLPTVGAESVDQDRTLSVIRDLGDAFKLVWNKRVRRGFFMRSEDFFGFVKRIAATREEMLQEIAQVEEDYADRSEHARGLARMAYARELHALKDLYGDDLDANSHGESYFTLFQSRFVAGGLYLLDEPEAPLSPMRQLSLLTMLHQMVTEGDAQFIIATHSPILMAYPGATILNFDDGAIRSMRWDELDHVTITRDFLNNPDAYLRHLISDNH